jgi:hypothetical protein
MSRPFALAVGCGFVIGLLLGCGSSKPPEAAGGVEPSPKPGDPPKPATADEVAAAKVRLAEVVKAIAAKEKELAALRVEEGELRRKIAPAEGKVSRTAAELFAGMPKDVYPKTTDTGIERTATRKWIDDNLLGTSFEWDAKLTGFNAEGEKEPLAVWFKTDERVKRYVNTEQQNISGYGKDAIALGQIKLGEQDCEVYLANNTPNRSNYHVSPGPAGLYEYYRCSLAEAKALRAFNDTNVTLRGRITEVEIHNTGWVVGDRHKAWVAPPERVAFFVKLHSAAINGYLPENSRPPDKK